MVPGGEYFMIFASESAYTLSLEELRPTPTSLISLPRVELEGQDGRTYRWNIGRPDDGSLTFYAIIRPIDRCVSTSAKSVRDLALMMSSGVQCCPCRSVCVLVGQLPRPPADCNISRPIHNSRISAEPTNKKRAIHVQYRRWRPYHRF